MIQIQPLVVKEDLVFKLETSNYWMCRITSNYWMTISSKVHDLRDEMTSKIPP